MAHSIAAMLLLCVSTTMAVTRASALKVYDDLHFITPRMHNSYTHSDSSTICRNGTCRHLHHTIQPEAWLEVFTNFIGKLSLSYNVSRFILYNIVEVRQYHVNCVRDSH